MNKKPIPLHDSIASEKDDSNEKPNLHFTFQPIYSNRRTRLPGHETGWRRLPASLIEIPVSGSWTLDVRDQEGRNHSTYEIPEKAVAFVPSGTVHRLRWSSSRRGETAYLLGRFLWMGGIDALRVGRIPHVLPASSGRLIEPFLSKMISIAFSNPSIREVAKYHEHSYRILSELLSHAKETRLVEPRERSLRLLPVLNLLNQNSTESFSISDLADRSGLSHSRFHVLFKELTGLAPKTYLRNIRCDKACEYLVRTELSIREISSKCGYESEFYFSRIFKKALGVSPARYRKSFHEGEST